MRRKKRKRKGGGGRGEKLQKNQCKGNKDEFKIVIPKIIYNLLSFELFQQQIYQYS